MQRLLRLLPLLALCACSTLRGRADDLARKGQFVEAAEIYDDLVRKEPNDATLVSARDDLRWKALEQLLGQARRHRLEGDDENAESRLEQFLAHRVRWGSKLNGALESSLLEEMEGTHRHARRLIVAPAQKGLALTADAALVRKRSLLAHREMAPILREMEGAVVRSGKAGCVRLKQVSTEGPHWAELVARYCRRWQESAPEPPLIPEALGAPLWSGSIEGLGREQVEFLQARLARSFEASPWYLPGATQRTSAALEGRFTTHHQRDPIRLTASWTDREPYTDHEERVEKYEEPYEVEETYTENGETKRRTVTKYRTREHKYTVPVTRYRDVPKSFEYSAMRHAVLYRFSVASTVLLDARRSPVSALVADELSQHAYEHDITFAPADVRPVRASLPKGDAFFAEQVKALERSFAAQLGAAWREYYCSGPSPTLDEAARCARAGTELPPGVAKVLAEVLGEDAPRASSLFARP